MEPILYIGISQFLFAALLIFTKPRRHLGDATIGIWLLLMCLFMGLTLAKAQNPETFWSRMQLFPFFFTIGPFLLLYVRFLTGMKKHFVFEDGLHILPFAVFSAVAVTQSHTVDEDIVAGNLFKPEMIIYVVSTLSSFVYYLFATFLVLRKHQQKIKDYFSYSSGRISLRWVQMAAFILSLTLLLTILSVPVNTLNGAGTLNPGIPLFLGLTIFGYGVAFFGVRQPAIFADKPQSLDDRFVDSLEDKNSEKTHSSPEGSPRSGHDSSSSDGEPGADFHEKDGNEWTKADEFDDDEDDDDEDDDEKKNKKYSRSGLRPRQAENYLERLHTYLKTDQPYLRRDLTIQDIALALDIPQHHLTQTINELLEKNFYTLINEYRVEEVKGRLLNPKYKHLTVLAIAHDAGFNSKSSFNMTFKKYVGLTPSQYRKKHLG